MVITQTRRSFLARLLALGALALMPLKLLARNQQAFGAEEVDAALQALVGDKPLVKSTDIMLKVPDIAENGAVVPVTVTTTIAGVQRISLIVDENPNPLSASFRLLPGSVADISTRVKMGASSDVRAIVETQTTAFYTTKNVKVTIGGCGG
jgi:sulfur-oxidizing protein SoxY